MLTGGWGGGEAAPCAQSGLPQAGRGENKGQLTGRGGGRRVREEAISPVGAGSGRRVGSRRPTCAPAVTWQQERPGSVSPPRPPSPHGVSRAGCCSCPTAVPDAPHRAAITQPPRLPVEPRPLPSQELSAGGKERARPFASLGPAPPTLKAASDSVGQSFGLSVRLIGRSADSAAAMKLARNVIFYLPPLARKEGIGIVRATASVEGQNELVASVLSEINI